MHQNTRRRGVVAVFAMVMILTLLGFAALTIDTGVMYNTRADLQRTADASALAAAMALADEEDPYLAATQVAAGNPVFAYGPIKLAMEDVQSGRFDTETGVFTAGLVPTNAIRVVARRDAESANGALELYFARLMGKNTTNVRADAVAMVPALSDVTEATPLALRSPGFGSIDPDITAKNPGKDGPSEPGDGEMFRIGEKVTVFIFGKGKASPVHLILNTNDIPGEVHLGKVMNGEEPGVPLAVDEPVDVLGGGTGHNGIGGKLADRLTDGDPDNDIIIMPVVKPILNAGDCESDCIPTFDEDGRIVGDVLVADFIAVRLDAVEEVEVPDPNSPNDLGKVIIIEVLVGYVVEASVAGGSTSETSGFVDNSVTGRLQLVR